eukprot:UN01950
MYTYPPSLKVNNSRRSYSKFPSEYFYKYSNFNSVMAVCPIPPVVHKNESKDGLYTSFLTASMPLCSFLLMF